MTFPFDAYLAALLGAFFTTLLSLPLWRKWCLRTGLVDDPGHRKIHATPIPLAGGLAVLTGIFLPILIGAGIAHGTRGTSGTAAHEELFGVTSPVIVKPIAHGFERRGIELGAILLGALGMAALGWWDDKHELKAGPKFTGQLLIAVLVAAAGVRITLFVPSVVFSYAVTICWILTITNAVNFMDNMNGLCAGVGAIAATFFAVIAAIHGQYLVTLLALLAVGALLGFLPHNFPKAGAFLGDAGSHLTGYLLAVLAILPHFYTRRDPDRLAVLSPLLVLAVPLGDLVWVVIFRWRNGKPFYVGDTNHLSHRLVRRGLSQTRAVLVIWLLAAVGGALAFLL